MRICPQPSWPKYWPRVIFFLNGAIVRLCVAFRLFCVPKLCSSWLEDSLISIFFDCLFSIISHLHIMDYFSSYVINFTVDWKTSISRSLESNTEMWVGLWDERSFELPVLSYEILLFQQVEQIIQSRLWKIKGVILGCSHVRRIEVMFVWKIGVFCFGLLYPASCFSYYLINSPFAILM